MALVEAAEGEVGAADEGKDAEQREVMAGLGAKPEAAMRAGERGGEEAEGAELLELGDGRGGGGGTAAEVIGEALGRGDGVGDGVGGNVADGVGDGLRWGDGDVRHGTSGMVGDAGSSGDTG